MNLILQRLEWNCILLTVFLCLSWSSAFSFNYKSLNEGFTLKNNETGCILVSNEKGPTELCAKILRTEIHYMIHDSYTFYHPEVNVDCECTCGDFNGQCSVHSRDRINECAENENRTEQSCTNFYGEGELTLCPKYYKVCCQFKISKRKNSETFRAVSLKSLETALILLELDITLRNSSAKLFSKTLNVTSSIKRFSVYEDIVIELTEFQPPDIIPEAWYYLKGEILMGNVNINEKDGEDFNKLGWFQVGKNEKMNVITTDYLEKNLKVKPTQCETNSVKYDWELNAINFYRDGTLQSPNEGDSILNLHKDEISNMTIDNERRVVSAQLTRDSGVFVTVIQRNASLKSDELKFNADLLQLSGSETTLLNITIASGRGPFIVKIGIPEFDDIHTFQIHSDKGDSFPYYKVEKIDKIFISGSWVCLYNLTEKQHCVWADVNYNQEMSTTLSKSTVNVTSMPPIMPNIEATINKDNTSDDSLTNSGIIVGAIVTLLLIIIIIIIICIVYRRHKKINDKVKEEEAKKILLQDTTDQNYENSLRINASQEMENKSSLLIIPLPKIEQNHFTKHIPNERHSEELFISENGDQKFISGPEELFSGKGTDSQWLNIFMQNSCCPNLLYILAKDFVFGKVYLQLFERAYLITCEGTVDANIADFMKREKICLISDNSGMIDTIVNQNKSNSNTLLLIDNKEAVRRQFREFVQNNVSSKIFSVVNENEEDMLASLFENVPLNTITERKKYPGNNEHNPNFMKLISYLFGFRDTENAGKTLTDTYDNFINFLVKFTEENENELKSHLLKLGELTYNAHKAGREFIKQDELNVLPDNENPIFNLMFVNFCYDDENNSKKLEFLHPFFFHYLTALYLLSLDNKEIQFMNFPFSEAEVNLDSSSLIRHFLMEMSVKKERYDVVFNALNPWAFWCSVTKFIGNRHTFQVIINLLGKINFKFLGYYVDFFYPFIPKVWDINDPQNAPFFSSEWHTFFLLPCGRNEVFHIIRWNPTISVVLPNVLHVNVLEVVFNNYRNEALKRYLSEGKTIFCTKLVLRFQSLSEEFTSWKALRDLIQADQIAVIIESNAMRTILPSLRENVVEKHFKDNQLQSINCEINEENVSTITSIADIVQHSYVKSLILHLLGGMNLTYMEMITKLTEKASNSTSLENIVIKSSGKFTHKINLKALNINKLKDWNYVYVDKNVNASFFDCFRIKHLDIDGHSLNSSVLSEKVSRISELEQIGSEIGLLKTIIERMDVSRCKTIHSLNVKIYDEFYEPGHFKIFSKLPKLKDISVSFPMRTFILSGDDVKDITNLIIDNKLRNLRFLDVDFNVLNFIKKILDELLATSPPASRTNSGDSADKAPRVPITEHKLYLIQTFSIDFKGHWDQSDVDKLFEIAGILLRAGKIESFAFTNMTSTLNKFLYEKFPPSKGFLVSWDIPEINDIENIFTEKIRIQFNKSLAKKMNTSILI